GPRAGCCDPDETGEIGDGGRALVTDLGPVAELTLVVGAPADRPAGLAQHTAVARARDERRRADEAPERRRLVPGLAPGVADLAVGVVAPTHDRSFHPHGAGVIVTAADRGRVAQPPDRDRSRTRGAVDPPTELAAIVGAPADHGPGLAPGAAVRATEGELDRIADTLHGHRIRAILGAPVAELSPSVRPPTRDAAVF